MTEPLVYVKIVRTGIYVNNDLVEGLEGECTHILCKNDIGSSLKRTGEL